MNEAGKNNPTDQLNYEDVLITVANPETARQLVTMAHLITTHQTTFHIMNVTLQGPFPEEESNWRQGSELVMDTTHYAQRLGRVAKPLTVTSDSIPSAIVNSAMEIGTDFILMGWFGRITPMAVRRSAVVNKVLKNAPCDAGVLKSRKDLTDLKKILMPVGPNKPRPERLALVDRLLRDRDVEVELVHVLMGEPTKQRVEKATEYLKEVKEMLTKEVNTKTIHAKSVLSGLLTASEDEDLIILGPGREWVFDRFLFGRTTDNLTNEVESSVLIVKESEYKMIAWTKGLVKVIVDSVKGILPG